MKGKLLLTDEQGTVLESWTWADPFGEEDAITDEIDFLVPLQKFGPADLAAQINMAVRRAFKNKEK